MTKKSTAIVMKSVGSTYTIKDKVTDEILESGIRGRIRLEGMRTTNPVAVGDRVDYEVDDYAEAVIVNIHPRRNYIIRRASNLSKESHIIASNLDSAMMVATLIMPETNFEFIDRFLVTCEAYSIPAAILLNKIDLLEGLEEAVEEFHEIYNLAGYEVIDVSAVTGENMDVVEGLLKNKVTLLTGNSGVGKSTLINYIQPEFEIKTAEISDYHLMGRHTTTFAQMYELEQGGYIIDTPGIKGFGLIDIEDDELYHFFPELMKYSEGCQFYNCTHTHEPKCAVRRAVIDGKISESRYINYLKMLEEDEKYR